MNEIIIVGVDRTDTALRAARKAVEVARAHGASLHIITSVERSSGELGSGSDRIHFDSLSDGDNFLRALVGTLEPDEVTTAVTFDDPARMMCDEAERLGARTIVVGNRRVQGAARVLGSVAAKVIRNATCDVLVVNTAER